MLKILNADHGCCFVSRVEDDSALVAEFANESDAVKYIESLSEAESVDVARALTLKAMAGKLKREKIQATLQRLLDEKEARLVELEAEVERLKGLLLKVGITS